MRSMIAIVCSLAAGCVKAPDETTTTPATSGGAPTPSPSDPFAGLPALSDDGLTLALPTYSTADGAQSRAIAFVMVGDSEMPAKLTAVPDPASPAVIDVLNQRFSTGGFQSVPWVMTPKNPPFPMKVALQGTELYFDGDPRAQITASVHVGDHEVGRDVYQLLAESESSPDQVVTIGAAVIRRPGGGFAYVRYDVADRIGIDSQWRIVDLAAK